MRDKTVFSVSFAAFVLLLVIAAYAAEMAGKCSLCGMNLKYRL